MCNKDVTYKSYKSYWGAKNRNATCKSCRTVKANKSRDVSMQNNHQWKGYKDIPYSWFSRYFERKGRGRTGTITIEDVYNLWIQQDKKCALSGLPIGFYDDGENHTASIDRIDSNGEYTLDNIQLVHKDINIMKNKYSQEYFIKVCKLVTSNQED